jgi:hypothetical protein
MLAIVPVLIFIGGFSVGAYEQSFDDMAAAESEKNNITLLANKIESNNDGFIHFN